jgi:AhpD family alkylhydroperoxidase
MDLPRPRRSIAGPPTATIAWRSTDRRNAKMMLDWNDYYQQVMARIGELGQISPDTVRGYRAMSDAGAKTGKLDAKFRELIALAVAVTRQCDGCIAVHTDAAVKHGATREEVAEALGVAIAVNAGAALVYSARVMDAYSAKTAGSGKAGP